MKTAAFKSVAPNPNPTHDGNDNLRALNVESLRTAVDALLRGDFEAAQQAIQARRDSTIRPVAAPIELETAAPDFVQADADAAVAWELYQEAWKHRQGLLEAFLAHRGPIAVTYRGESYNLVKRVRNGHSAVFLRRSKV